MIKKICIFLQYMMSPEESRMGRTDYWSGVYMADRTPGGRIGLGCIKVLFVISLAFALTRLLAQL